MVFKKFMAATAAVALAATPAVAQNGVAPAVETVEADSQLGGPGSGGGFLIPLLALGAIVLGILVLLDDDDDAPTSP